MSRSSSSSSRAESFISEHTWLRQLRRSVRRSEAKEGARVAATRKHLRTRARRQTACEHVLRKVGVSSYTKVRCAHSRKKHAYCEVCYTCAVCDEVFLRKNYSRSEHVSSDKGASRASRCSSRDSRDSEDSRHCGHFNISMDRMPDTASISCIVE